MQGLRDLSAVHPLAWAVLVFSGVGAAGLALSSLKIRGVVLGITGVLFAGILVHYFGIHGEIVLRRGGVMAFSLLVLK